MKSKKMMEKNEFSLEFIWKLYSVTRLFKNPQFAVVMICCAWGGCTIEEAEGDLESLKKSLLEADHEKYGGPDYTGEKTFESEIESLIEDLRQAVSNARKSELAGKFAEIVRGDDVAG